jgi:hypothetical protein
MFQSPKALCGRAGYQKAGDDAGAITGMVHDTLTTYSCMELDEFVEGRQYSRRMNRLVL